MQRNENIEKVSSLLKAEKKTEGKNVVPFKKEENVGKKKKEKVETEGLQKYSIRVSKEVLGASINLYRDARKIFFSKTKQHSSMKDLLNSP